MDNQRTEQLLNELINEVRRTKQQNAAIIDQMNPTYTNVIDIHQWVYNIQNEQSSIKGRLAQIEGQLQQILQRMR